MSAAWFQFAVNSAYGTYKIIPKWSNMDYTDPPGSPIRPPSVAYHGATKTSICTEPLCEPPTPVTVTVYVTLVVLLPADAVSSTAANPPEVSTTLLELSDTVGGCFAAGVTPTDSVTVLENPLRLTNTIVEFPLPPFPMEMEV